MLTIMKQDLINLWKNKPIMMYLLMTLSQVFRVTNVEF